MLPKNIESQKDILRSLVSSKKSIRTGILKNGDKKLVQAICECCYNLLQGTLILNNEQKTELSKFKHSFRKLIEKSSLKTKKKILSQHGGFLPYLLPLVLNEVCHEAGGSATTRRGGKGETSKQSWTPWGSTSTQQIWSITYWNVFWWAYYWIENQEAIWDEEAYYTTIKWQWLGGRLD